MANGHGGKREGAGRRYGSKNHNTLVKAEAREEFRIWITERRAPIAEAMYASATGIRHLMWLNPETGKPERVTGVPKEIDAALASGAFWIYTKDPNVAACVDLLNRASDCPALQVELAGDRTLPIEIRWRSSGEGQARELEDGNDPLLKARKVNGHVEDET